MVTSIENQKVAYNADQAVSNLFKSAPAIIVDVDSSLPPLDLPTVVPSINTLEDEEADTKLVRDNLKAISEKACTAIDELSELANQSEAPRMYEVLSTMINTATNLNKEMLSLHKNKNKQVTAITANGIGIVNHNQQNIVFTGTPAELLSQLKLLNNNDKK